MIDSNRQINICPIYFVTDKVNIVIYENRSSCFQTVHEKVKHMG